MLHITRGIENTVYFTVRDKKVGASGANFYHLFKFVNDMTKEEVFIMGGTNSVITHFIRHSFLTFTEGGSIIFNPEGFWQYTIYETTDNTLTDDSTLTTSDIVEQGKAFVKDNAVTEVSYTQYTPTDNTNTTNKNTVYLNI